jgi:hypothetical protein
MAIYANTRHAAADGADRQRSAESPRPPVRDNGREVETGDGSGDDNPDPALRRSPQVDRRDIPCLAYIML